MIEKLHRFDKDVGDVDDPRLFTCPFDYVPHPLAVAAAEQVQRYVASHGELARELDQGKMLGVLVVRDDQGSRGFVAAFSGTVLGGAQHDYFVPPIYDLQDPEGEFKRGEAQLSAINKQVDELAHSDELATLQQQLTVTQATAQQEQRQYKALMARHKAERDRARLDPALSATQAEALLNQSRHEKASLVRLRRKHQAQLQAVGDAIERHRQRIDALREQRKRLSEALQERIFHLFVVSNAQGEQRDLVQVWAPLGTLPPAGAGECCAPRLLNYAYRQGWHPLAMAEFWWGASPVGVVRHHGHYYPACRSKCKPILDFMLQGLAVEDNRLAIALDAQQPLDEVYDDQWLTIVNKPVGMLTVPGRLLTDSLYSRYREAHPEAHGPIVVHRLDQETSGLVVLAKTKEVHARLQAQFAERRVEKRYVALLDGIVEADEGVIDLPLLPDVSDRPRQRVDGERGKPAITRYRVLAREGGVTRVAFEPLTGRTHQLRVHASHVLGLGCPIVGDRLYGRAAARLYLHAQSLRLQHPITQQMIAVRVEADF